ncbi:hypothetical protein AX769_18770 [Frondihabitans sp. PAMC 28766]|uniref:Pr6Pr family membrane protein n=1 Tax=Frondihabitans sp. PAMC 28766 TaxID=1795630 RepID=UPI00078CBE02|nr:Pr6Pr family membrane protein [Frondihabitans sp. PAMC 28766]AMM21817.1 hypothetical protein AX769_18770 [Frondihabitans sp. PAMC 28766]
MRYLFAGLRLAVAVLIIVAVVGQLMRSVLAPSFFFFNFFGFFTIQSNLLIAGTFALTAAVSLTAMASPPWLVVARGATVTYMATTGIVYNLILANQPLGDFNVAWSNDILHRVVPIIAIVEWVLLGDHAAIPWRRLWFFLIYPIVWLIATLARGQSFVPYPFLNTVTIGWGAVLLYCLVIAVFVAAMSALVIWLSRLHLVDPLHLPVDPREVARRKSSQATV